MRGGGAQRRNMEGNKTTDRGRQRKKNLRHLKDQRHKRGMEIQNMRFKTKGKIKCRRIQDTKPLCHFYTVNSMSEQPLTQMLFHSVSLPSLVEEDRHTETHKQQNDTFVLTYQRSRYS